jgi:cysteine synthase A
MIINASSLPAAYLLLLSRLQLTRNFDIGRKLIDDAYRVTDQEAISMSRHLVMHDGLFLGSSSACNLVASVKLAKTLPKGSTIVTIL